jgi:hypothetical protein
MRHVVL